MLGRQSRQLSFTSLENLGRWEGLPIVPEDSIYAALGRDQEIFRDELFAEAYASVGHPSKSPGLLSKVLVLQFLDNVSDRQAEERARYDLRWKMALGVGLSEAGFDATTLSKFRTRLLLFKKERVIFEQILVKAAQKGLLPKKRITQIMDSTFTLGAAAVQNTYALIRSAIRKLLNSLTKKPGFDRTLLAELKLDYQDRRKPVIDWNNHKVRETFLNDLVSDALLVLEVTAKTPLTEMEQKLRLVLEKVTYQDIEPKDGGSGVKIKQGVAQDRIISTVDPDMRHGHKSSSRNFDGYKTHITIEKESQFITGVAVTPGNVHDGQVAKDLVDQQPEEYRPARVIGDHAYGTGEVRKEMAERNIQVIAPVQEPPAPEGYFKKTDFQIDLEAQTCLCPAGNYAQRVKRDRKTNEVKAFHFSKDQCQACPLKGQCFSSKKGYRTVRLNPNEGYLQAGRHLQKTNEFKEEYRQYRPAVERKQAETVRHGARKARYFGISKVLLQQLFVAAAVNYKHYVKKIRELIQRAKKPLLSPQGVTVAR